MFSKPLFKQSCKANGVLWGIITAAVSIMLAVVVLVMGNANITQIKDSLNDAITKNVVEAQIDRNSMNFYYMIDVSLNQYDDNFNLMNTGTGILINSYDAKVNGQTDLTDEQKQAYIDEVIGDLEQNPIFSSFLKDPLYKEAMKGILHIYVFENTESGLAKEEITSIALQKMILEQVKLQVSEEYDEDMVLMATTLLDTGLKGYIAQKGQENPLTIEQFSDAYLPVSLTSAMSQALEEFGFDSETINTRITNALVEFKVQLDIRYEGQELKNIEQTEISALVVSLTGSLMDELPPNISESLKEMGDMDIFALVVGDIFFKIAGILLPMIYIIMTANALIAGQVDSGSMAYTLSTPTRRRTVAITQMTFLIVSLFAMFVCSSIVGVISLACLKPGVATISYGQMILFNLGAFVTLFAVAGICFMASCWFNRSKHSMAVGGGISMYFLVATILGLFGSKSFPSMIRIDAMNFFNYTTIISLFDLSSIMSGGLVFLWKFAILLGIGIICFIVGTKKFETKDLPL